MEVTVPFFVFLIVTSLMTLREREEKRVKETAALWNLTFDVWVGFFLFFSPFSFDGMETRKGTTCYWRGLLLCEKEKLWLGNWCSRLCFPVRFSIFTRKIPAKTKKKKSLNKLEVGVLLFYILSGTVFVRNFNKI